MKKFFKILIVTIASIALICSFAACSSAAEHNCQSKCTECGKCLDKNCTEKACKDKCQGHNGGSNGGFDGEIDNIN